MGYDTQLTDKNCGPLILKKNNHEFIGHSLVVYTQRGLWAAEKVKKRLIYTKQTVILKTSQNIKHNSLKRNQHPRLQNKQAPVQSR